MDRDLLYSMFGQCFKPSRVIDTWNQANTVKRIIAKAPDWSCLLDVNLNL